VPGRLELLALAPHATDRCLLAVDGGLPAIVLEDGAMSLLRANRAFSELLGLRVTSLRTVRTGDRDALRVVVLELHDRPEPGRWTPADELVANSGLTPELQSRLTGLLEEPIPPQRAPWQLRGWFSEACGWIDERLAAVGRERIGPVEQARNWCLSSILRVPTDVGAVWLKSTAGLPLFVDEGRVMTTLAALFPGRVPAPIAVDSGRRLMLLEDLGDNLDSAGTSMREALFGDFARLQLEAAAHVHELVGAGCVERGPEVLAAQLEQLLEPGREALEASELARLEALLPRFVDDCAALASGPVPPSLVHGDFHTGNVAAADAGHLIFDWSDASIAHPFLDLSEIVAERDDAVRERLLAAYLEPWKTTADAGRLRELWHLARPLAALHQAVSYVSIVANVEADEAAAVDGTAYWLRLAIAAADAPG
jgi:hypothetical protein